MNSASSRPARSTSRRQTVSTGVCMNLTGMPTRAQGTPSRLTWMRQASVPLSAGMGSTW